MGVKGKFFIAGGKATTHYLPGAYSKLDFIRGSGGLVSINNAVIMGDCRGGEPNKLLVFGSATHASDFLRSGHLLDAIKHAFSPGGGLVPQRIAAWRVNVGTQSTHDYKESTNTMIECNAKDYGLHTNQIKTKLETGTGTVGKKVTIQFMDNEAEVWDKVEKKSFKMMYTGAGDDCMLVISKTQLSTTCTGAPTDNLTMLFSVYETVEEMVNYINDQTNYTATVLTSTPLDPSIELDSLASHDIKDPDEETLLSDLQAVIDVLNESIWVEANYYAAATTRAVPDNETSWVYFSGAVDGSYDVDAYGVSLSLLEEEDIQFVGSSNETNTIHAVIKTHCEKMNSTMGKNERQFVLGGAAGETIVQAKVRAVDLTSDAGMIKFPGFKHWDFNDLSKKKTWSPAYYAAKIIGMIVSLAIQEPITNKSVDVLEWEKKLTIIEAEELIKAGISCGIASRSGRLVNARGVTTHQGDKLQQCEFSMMRISLFTSKDLRTAVEQSFIGRAMSNTMIGKVDAVAVGRLSDYSDMGLFVGDPPYWGYKKDIQGDVIRIDYDANITPPMNFMFIASHLHVYASISG